MPEPPRVPDSPQLAPPTLPTSDISTGPSTWPGVIGALLCVFAGVGILSRAFSTLLMAVAPAIPFLRDTMPSGPLLTWGIVLSVVGLPTSAIHLIAGIQTLRRRPSARRWVIVFFVYVLVLVVPNAIFQYYSGIHQMQQMQQMQSAGQQGAPPPGMAAVMQGANLAGVAFALVFPLLWPAFLLVWFSRRSIRDEMATWEAA